MRSYLFLTLIFFVCSAFLNDDYIDHRCATKGFFDFAIHRLSNERVFISWHTAGDDEQATYELLRKHTKRDSFATLAIVQPESMQGNTADYSFTDSNSFSDSSYYCLKKTNSDGVIFYSITKGIEGTAKER
jgi:hypothetical protein